MPVIRSGILPIRSEARAHRESPARSRPRHRHDRPPAVRRVRRAPRPVRLRRHLRARASRGRRARVPARRAGAGARAGADDRALSRRQLRLGLQLGGRGRPARASAEAARPRLAVDRDQRVRHRRVHRLVPGGRRRADARGQPRHARCGRRAQPGRVLQPSGRDRAVRPAPRAWLGAAARRQVLVPGQRDGRPLADGREDPGRIRPHRRRGGQADEVGRPDHRARRVRLVRAEHADLRDLGRRSCSSTASTTSSTSRCTPT